MIVYASTNRIELVGPEEPMGSEEELKEWLWDHHKEKLLGSMVVEYAASSARQERLNSRFALLDKVAKGVQRQYLLNGEGQTNKGRRHVFNELLEGILELMNSEYGFVAEVAYDDDGTMYLQNHALTNIAWDDATRALYADNVETGLKFYNMNTLFGNVVLTKAPVISNKPLTDKRASGVPPGHPPLNHFLGLPVFDEGGVLIGMMGMANKPGGYSNDDVAFLRPFTLTCSNLIQACWQMQKNQNLINTLEQKVEERTRKLQHANRDLEEANRLVMANSEAQLRQFACMSHEIRTPLNCILGLTSILLETPLNPMQEESLRMMSNGGDLLLTVVNDLLDYSKLESGNVDFDITRSNLQETLNSTVHSLQLKAETKNIKVRAFYDVAVPEFVQTDSRRLQQILYNLLGNAVKFSHNGTTSPNVDLIVKVCAAGMRCEGFSPLCPEDKVNETRRAIMLHSSDQEQTKLAYKHKTTDLGRALSPLSELFSGAVKTTEKQTTDVRLGSERQSLGTSAEKNGSALSYEKKTEHEKSVHCPFHKQSPKLGETEEVDTVSSMHDNDSEHVSPCPFRNGNERSSDVLDPRKQDLVLRFIVQDYGKGIEEKDFGRIFQPFHQASRETERVYGGTGLGLAVTAKLVHGLGGKISVKSKKEQGSKFTVDLPFRDAPADVEGLSKRLSNTAIFLIHPDQEIIAQVSHTLKRYGAKKILKFSNLKEQASKIRQQVPLSQDWVSIYIVHEDLYDETSYMELSKRTKSVLLTCGPKHGVKATDGHYRYLDKVLPDVLMKFVCAMRDRRLKEYQTNSSGTRSSGRRSSANNVPYRDFRVLVAEDNLINQKVLIRMLQRLGVQRIDVVDNGQKAVDLERLQPYDVVLMDMQMPVMDGVEACRLIVGRTGGHKKATVVFVTAHVFSNFEAECVKAGGEGFVGKPYSILDIDECLQRIHQLRSSREDLVIFRQ